MSIRHWIDIVEGEVIHFTPKQPRKPLGIHASYRLGDWIALNNRVGQIVGYHGEGAGRDFYKVNFPDGQKTVSHLNLRYARPDEIG